MKKISPKIFEKLSDTDIEDILGKSMALKKLKVVQDSSDEERGENIEMCETQSSPEIPDDICSDLNDISSFINIGEDLQLQDFTDSSTFLNFMKVL